MTSDFKIKNEIKSLTAFRFLAAFYVFLFHVNARAPIFSDSLLGYFVDEGAVGMTMFFVLSGFILSHAYHSINIDLRNYLWNRVARIYPIYFLAAILALPWLAKDILSQPSLFQMVGVGIILFIFGLLLIQAWIPQTFSFWNNSASWSISNEAFFYTVFPFLHNHLPLANIKILIYLFIGLSLISSMIPASAIVFENAPDSFPLFYALPIFRLPEFVCGMISYTVMMRVGWSTKIRNFLLFLVILGVAHVALLGSILPGYTLHNYILIPCVSSSLVLLYKGELNGISFFGNRVFVWLGQISYCFYSFQFHVLEGLRSLLPLDVIGPMLYAISSTIILLIVAALAHHLVEEPARVWIRQRTMVKRAAEGVII